MTQPLSIGNSGISHPLLDKVQDLIQKKNAEKEIDAPAAIIFLATVQSDTTNAFYNCHLEYKIYALTKIHHVTLRILENPNNLSREVSNIKAKIDGRSITVLTLNGHGMPDHILFGSGRNLTDRYYAKDVSAADFHELDPTATIILDACSTGQQLAKKIASVQERRVVAPITDTNAPSIIYFSCCREDGYTMAGYSLGDNINKPTMNVKIFHKKGNEVVETIPCLEKIQNAYKEMATWTMEKAQNGDHEAQNFLGYYHLIGLGVEQSEEKGLEWFQKAANQGNPPAQISLGMFYQNGQHVAQSHEAAVNWFRKAAGGGNSKAYHYLGRCYELGHGVAQSSTEAFKCYEKAAHLGKSDHQFHLGMCYYNGLGIEQSYEKAIEWFQKAEEQNHHSAPVFLGMCYLMLEAEQEAIKWFKIAANKGNPEDQYFLGECYELGRYVEQSPEKAVEWYEKAAKQGLSKANFKLRSRNEQELDVIQSDETVLKWDDDPPPEE